MQAVGIYSESPLILPEHKSLLVGVLGSIAAQPHVQAAASRRVADPLPELNAALADATAARMRLETKLMLRSESSQLRTSERIIQARDEAIALLKVELGSKIAQLRDRDLAAEQRIERDARKLEAAEADVAARNAEVAALQAGAATRQGQVTTLQGELTALQGEVVMLRREAATRQSQITALQGEAAALQRDAATLQGEVTALQQEAVARNGEAVARQSEVAALQGEVAALQGEVAALQRKLAARQADLAARERAQAQVTALEKSLRERRAEVADLTRILTQRDAELQAIKARGGWRAFSPVRRFGERHPRIARQAKRVGKLLWRTGTLPLPGAARNLLRCRRAIRIIQKSGLFLPQWYLSENPDVRSAGVDPLAHFIINGVPRGTQSQPALRYCLVPRNLSGRAKVRAEPAGPLCAPWCG